MAEVKEAGEKIATIRKITVKAVCGKVDLKALLNDPSGRMLLMRVVGVARRMKPITTDYGDSIGFIGEFRAVNTKGEKFRSSKMYLPRVMEEELEGIISAGSEAEFAFDISVVHDDELAIKYFYEATPVVEAQQSDAAARMFALLESGAGGEVKKLAAPEKESVSKQTGEISNKKPSGNKRK